MPKAEFTAQALNVLWAERCNTEDTFFKPSEMKDFRLSEKTEPMSIPPTRLGESSGGGPLASASTGGGPPLLFSPHWRRVVARRAASHPRQH